MSGGPSAAAGAAARAVARAATVGPRALVALGSNQNDPYRQMRRARDLLAKLGDLRAKSSLYRTAPVGGPAGQPPYLNAVAAIWPHPHLRDPHALLAALLDVEVRMGRTRSVRWGPRTIDLDLLDLGGLVVRSPGLRLPHPRMFERWFVLAPLCELDPGYRHPLDGRNACDTLARLERARAQRAHAERTHAQPARAQRALAARVRAEHTRAAGHAASGGDETPAGERTTLPW